MKLETLRKRREFLRVRGGARCSTHAFVLETKQRPAASPDPSSGRAPSGDGPRFGFTVTKRLGNAVKRNRIRRRLKAVLLEVAKTASRDHFDYVVIARAPARDMAFSELTGLMAKAFERVHQPQRKSNSPRKSRPAARSGSHNSRSSQTTQ